MIDRPSDSPMLIAAQARRQCPPAAPPGRAPGRQRRRIGTSPGDSAINRLDPAELHDLKHETPVDRSSADHVTRFGPAVVINLSLQTSTDPQPLPDERHRTSGAASRASQPRQPPTRSHSRDAVPRSLTAARPSRPVPRTPHLEAPAKSASLPTVYAALQLFEALGLMQRLDAAGGTAIGEPRTDGRRRFSGVRPVQKQIEDVDAPLEAAHALSAARGQGLRASGAELVSRCSAGAARAPRAGTARAARGFAWRVHPRLTVLSNR